MLSVQWMEPTKQSGKQLEALRGIHPDPRRDSIGALHQDGHGGGHWGATRGGRGCKCLGDVQKNFGKLNNHWLSIDVYLCCLHN